MNAICEHQPDNDVGELDLLTAYTERLIHFQVCKLCRSLFSPAQFPMDERRQIMIKDDAQIRIVKTVDYPEGQAPGIYFDGPAMTVGEVGRIMSFLISSVAAKSMAREYHESGKFLDDLTIKVSE